MKLMNRLFIVVAVAGTFFAASCNKDNKAPGDPGSTIILADEVTGTYSGDLKNSTTNQTQPATLTVSAVNDTVVTLHCVATDFDTTITLRLYENGDKMMVCYTGQNFSNQYGHDLDESRDFCNNKPNGWENDWCHDHNCWNNGDQWNAWTNHQNAQHQENDVHFGDFDLNNNACDYSFQVNTGNTTWSQSFTGVKQ